MMRFGFATAALTAIYVLALASANPWDLGAGAALALVLLTTFHRFIFPRHVLAPRLVLQRAVRAPALLLATVINIVRGTVQVTRVVLGLSSPLQAGFVDVPRAERTELGVVISGLLDTMSPGSVLIDIDDQRETWTIHALEAANTDAVRENLNAFYEQYQRPVWP